MVFSGKTMTYILAEQRDGVVSVFITDSAHFVLSGKVLRIVVIHRGNIRRKTVSTPAECSDTIGY